MLQTTNQLLMCWIVQRFQTFSQSTIYTHLDIPNYMTSLGYLSKYNWNPIRIHLIQFKFHLDPNKMSLESQ